MGALAGLGALAGGIAQGLERGQMMTQRQQQINANAKQQADNEKLQSDLAAADSAMTARLKGFEAEHAQSQPSAIKNYLTLGGSDGSMPDQTANDTPPAAATPFKPTEQHLLAAAQARTDKLFELGRHDQAVKQWAQDEGMRSQLRKQAVERGMLAYKASGDIKPLLTGVYQTIDDGNDLGNIEQVNNPDAKAPAAWNVERINQRTGEKTVQRVGADQIDGLVQFAMDPAQAARYSLMEKLAGFKGDQQRRTNDERGAMTLDQIGARSDGNLAVAGVRGETARDVAQIRVDGTISAAQIRAAAAGGRGVAGGGANGVQSKTELSDGRIALTMRDGTIKIATGDDGKPLTSLGYEKLVGQTASTVGKSLDGLTATPEKNRDRARNMLPKPQASRSLGDSAPASAPPKRLVYDPTSGKFN